MTRWRVRVARDAATIWTDAQAAALHFMTLTPAPGVEPHRALVEVLGLELVEITPEEQRDAEARADIGDTMRHRAKMERARTGKPPWGG